VSAWRARPAGTGPPAGVSRGRHPPFRPDDIRGIAELVERCCLAGEDGLAVSAPVTAIAVIDHSWPYHLTI